MFKLIKNYYSNNHATKNNDGFTLIELIIYLALVSMILVSISWLILEIVSGQTGSQSQLEVNYNMRFISQKLTSDIHRAQDIGSLSSSSVTLTMPGDDIAYVFNTSNGTLERQQGSNPAEVLNTSVVAVQGTFINQSHTNRTKTIGVEFQVSYRNPDNLPDYDASGENSLSIEARGRK